MSVAVEVLRDNELDWSTKLLSASKHEGVKRYKAARSRKKLIGEKLKGGVLTTPPSRFRIILGDSEGAETFSLNLIASSPRDKQRSDAGYSTPRSRNVKVYYYMNREDSFVACEHFAA